MMPLLQELLAQPLIVVILALIGALIFIAFAAIVFAQIRQMQRRGARRRERKMQVVKARRAARVTSTDIDEEQAAAVVVIRGAATAPLDPMQLEKAPNATVVSAPVVPTVGTPPPTAAVTPDATTPPAETTEEQKTAEEQKAAEDNAMSSLLSDVFSDEEVSAEKEKVLAVTEPVDIHELAALTKEIATQLGMNDISGAPV